jgi:hypothetical protein
LKPWKIIKLPSQLSPRFTQPNQFHPRLAIASLSVLNPKLRIYTSLSDTAKKKEEKGKYTIKRRSGSVLRCCVFPNLRTLSIPRHTQHQNNYGVEFHFLFLPSPEKIHSITQKIPLVGLCWLNHFQLIRRTVNIFIYSGCQSDWKYCIVLSSLILSPVALNE